MSKEIKRALLLALAGSGSHSVSSAATAAATAPASPTYVTPGPTATPTLPTIYENGYEILFPMLLRFYTVLRLGSSSVKSAKLHIFQGGVIDQTAEHG